jgi:uncharacterized membrane protein YfcA
MRLVSLSVGAERILKLAAIGTAAGAFSGLFGVGGGTIIVPLLILWLGYGERLATGTSLAAIVAIAFLAAAAQGGFYGNVDLGTGLWLALPAIGGVLVGTAAQQRLSQRAVSLLFAALLVAVAVELVVQWWTSCSRRWSALPAASSAASSASAEASSSFPR